MSRTLETTAAARARRPASKGPVRAAASRWIISFIVTSSLGLLAACAGEVGEVDQDEDAVEGSRERDAGKKRDAAAKRDARAETDDDDDDDDDDDGEQPDAQTVPRMNGSSDAGRDAGRDAASDASRDGSLAARDASAAADAGEPMAAAPSSCPDGLVRAAASGLKIREIALYQTVKVSLYNNGAWIAQRTLPVVQGKKSLVRVFVDVAAGAPRTPVRGSLILQNDGMTSEVVDERTIAASSTDADVNSTFTFQVDGARLGANTQLSVALEEPTCGDAPNALDGARFPPSGMQALSATAIGKLRMVIVPINVGGRVPVTTEAEVAAIRAGLLAYYPVPDVEVTVRAKPIMWTGTLAGTDNAGWTNMLNQVMRERSTDRAESDVYYFGLVQPAATMMSYCGRGCILGIAPQTVRVSANQQVGLGASFANAQTYETIVHEIGHAHGRGHAPCAQGGQIQGVDSRFPDRTGAIGTWGWDSRSNKLIPATHKDIMGYCSPNWISAYTYQALATRALAVNKKLFVFNSHLATPWDGVLLYSDGSARWSGTSDTEMPGGDLEPAQVLDASGRVIEEIEVIRIPLSHNDDQLLYLPSPGAKWSTLVLKDRTIELAAIKSAI